MSFLSEARRALRKEISLLSKRIKQSKKDLNDIKIVLEGLRSQAEKRIIHNYKYGKIRNIELLLTSSSYNQALVRYKYLRLFWLNEVKLINDIKLMMEEKIAFEKTIVSDLKDRKNALQERENDHKKYLAKKKVPSVTPDEPPE